GEQGEGEAFGVAELDEFGLGVGGDAENYGAGGVQGAEVVAEVAGLFGAAGGAGGGGEVGDDALAAVVAEGGVLGVGVGEGEVGRGVAGGQAYGHGSRRYREPGSAGTAR